MKPFTRPRASRSLALLLAAAMAGLPPHVGAADSASERNPAPASEADPFPIDVRVSPAVVLAAGKAGPGTPPAKPLRVSGQTLRAGERPVAISIVPAGGAATPAAQAVPDARGDYSVDIAAPAAAGIYRVDVVAPDGRGKASATFKAVQPADLGGQIDTTLAELDQAVDDGVKEAEAKVDAQIDSPAKERAKQKIAGAKKALAEARAPTVNRALRGTIGAISSDAALLEAMRPKLAAVTSAVAEAAAETARVRALTAQMSSADIGCHQLAFVSEVWKAISALLNVKRKVLDSSVELSKDIVADAASVKAKGLGAGPTLAFATEQAMKNLPELTSASKLAGNAYSILADAGAFVSDTLFGMYCEQLAGPLEGIMNARFFKAPRAGDPPALWWSYNYRITGRVVLYYPKSAKGSGPIRLNGRIEGVAHSFDTWEDALTVIFPKLMNGAIQKHYAFPPIETGVAAATVATSGGGGLSPYSQGSAAGVLVPNSFLISVTGVLEKGKITVVLGPAKKDIDATHRVAVLILSPLVGGLGAQVTWYPLGFQKTRNFLANAAEDETLKLDLVTQGDRMVGSGAFTGKVDKVTAKADYTLKVKACNPGC